MERINLPLRGIQRNKPASVSEDGVSQEIINLRPKDGAWRVVGKKPDVKSYSSGTKYHFKHQISPTRSAWWITRVDGGTLYSGYYLVDASDGAISSNLSVESLSTTDDNISFTALGNVVLCKNNGSETLSAYLFEPDEDSYRIIGDLLPDLLAATITSESDGTGDTLEVTDDTNNPPYMVKSTLDALTTSDLNSQLENGYWANNIYIRYAYELFDGSIVKHSAPIRVSGGYYNHSSDPATKVWKWNDSGFVQTVSTVFHKAKANFQLSESPSAVQGKYTGIIKSINIYASRPSSDIETVEGLDFDGDEVYRQGVDIEIIHTDAILDIIDNFYLVKTISLEDLSTDAVDVFEGFDLNDLAMKESLPVDNLSNHTLYSEDAFTYNQRLFWSKIKMTLFSGFSPAMSGVVDDLSGSDPSTWYIEVVIPTSQGEKTVISPAYSHTFSGGGSLSCFAYPDSRASKFRLLQYVSSFGKYYYTAYTSLTPHKHFNFAFIEDADYGITQNITSLPSENKTYWDYNRIQATEIMNPFYFPVENSYRAGRGTILGLSTNAIALSQGQFGQYPVYVFCTDGIWTLEIGSEETLVVSIKPLSAHVCNNKTSIQNIHGGSVFSTAKGLFVISGEKPIEISKEAEGKYTSPITENSDYETVMQRLGTDDLLCTEKFLSYLSGAAIGYNHIENEIVVSRIDRDYSWVYDLDNSWWYKIDQTWDEFMSDYPKMYGINTSDMVIQDLTTESTAPSSYPSILLETRPMQFGFKGLKKIARTLVECNLSNYYSSGEVGVYLYGSTDGSNWALVHGQVNENIVAGIGLRQILLGRTNYSCKLFILVITGRNMNIDDQYIEAVTMDVTGKFTKKLRLGM